MISGNLGQEPRQGRPPQQTPEQAFARSLLAERSLPSRRILCSTELGWHGILARTYRDPTRTEQFTTAQSCDLLVVLVVSGTFAIESRKGRRWQQANYHPGSVGVTAPDNVSVLRWEASPGQRLESLHMHLSADLLEETSDALGDRGPWSRRLPDALLLDDPLVTAAGLALGRALRRRAPALYADSIAQMLATHLLYGPEPAVAPGVGPAALCATAVRHIITYMHEHLHEDVSLDDLAAHTNVSKYHLLRSFAKSTGFTPHRYLVNLRMERAADLLRDTAQPVLQISQACGYRSQGQFAATFRRRFGVSPTDFRLRYQGERGGAAPAAGRRA
ncbi:helix-turn-helix domain-containing protein [Nonomuraea sp. NPDC049400]|uniref:helix-turn-helix domain-containing protein n=1 Tax=Nonomuraea sp. NPDC049400 TaxID=3364352 RepID=UPI0037A4820F